MKRFYINKKTYKATTTKGNTYKILKEINNDLGYGYIDFSVLHNHNIGTMVFNCITLKIAKKHPIYKQGNNLFLSQEYIKLLLNCSDADFERNEIGHNYKFTDIFWDDDGTAFVLANEIIQKYHTLLKCISKQCEFPKSISLNESNETINIKINYIKTQWQQ